MRGYLQALIEEMEQVARPDCSLKDYARRGIVLKHVAHMLVLLNIPVIPKDDIERDEIESAAKQAIEAILVDTLALDRRDAEAEKKFLRQ